MSILPGFGCPDKVGDVFSTMDRKGICEAGLGEVSSVQCLSGYVPVSSVAPSLRLSNGNWCNATSMADMRARRAALPFSEGVL